ncbi:MAG: ATP-dependent Clp protease ATP-binding subunit [Candidatus Hydrogenedentes bacterium]|nr:ATP-dependent Clp protease ATP-binding subunit [Candidatus Hydrogenedentota bacterium]
MQVPVSPEINALLDDATDLSVRRGQYYVGVEHLFETILVHIDDLPRSFRKHHGDSLKTAAQDMTREAWRGFMPAVTREVFYTPRCAALTMRAARLAQRLGNQSPTIGHLLLAILADAHAAPSRAMDRLRIPRGDMIKALRNELLQGAPDRTSITQAKTSKEAPQQESHETDGPVHVSEEEAMDRRAKKGKIDSLTRDLTAAAQAGELEPAIGRDKEIMTMLEILTRKTKNNIILVGEAGVGKTHIVEGLARLAAQDGAGGLFSSYRVVELNVASLMSGTQYRGAFEEKLEGLLSELKRARNTILFIDEIHLIMGAGTVEGGSMDMANLLKPALARGEIRCIGATTVQEYRKFIERDPALERRFQMVRVEELSPEATLEVLKHLRSTLQRHHGVRIGSKAMEAAVTLTQRYMPNRQFPDKAIDVLDQACARYRLRSVAAKMKPGLFESDTGTPQAEKVTPHDVRKVVSRTAGVPIEEITADERARLLDLEARLRRRIIGQDHAIAKAVAAVMKSRAGLADPNRPDSVMLFIGPTGVGKTQLAKALADYLFGSTKHLITFDMSEYVEEHSVSRLLGAPPGYVGADEEGRLAGAVRNAPFSVLLFDEIEKAHRRVFDVLLPVLDEGRIKDNRGREVSFRHCIIIFTSNAGADLVSRHAATGVTEDILAELRRHFRPEFINRIDEIVPFYPLLFEDVRTMLDLCIKESKARLKEKRIHLRVFQGAYELLAREGYNPQYGARELRRVVDRLVINPISTMLIERRFTDHDVIEVLEEGGELVFRKGESPSTTGAYTS